jgi:phosphatidylserine/phosphatidylglycerophosphate/cardiolipin synthase-like enzyme
MTRILNPGKTCRLEASSEHSRLLIDARDYYRAFYAEAARAERSILLAGWQFDSGVELLRGEDARDAAGPVEFLPFLEALCLHRPKLDVYILAWDFNPVFAMEREWLQSFLFGWTTPKNLRFHFDGQHPLGASHHQKFAVIDGCFAFAGGIDFASARWDDREHRRDNPLRSEDGEPQKPYHDVMAFVAGDAARELEGLFGERWRSATGESLELSPLPATGSREPAFAEGLAIESTQIGISCTECSEGVGASAEKDAKADGNRGAKQSAVSTEILCLYETAISEAERLVYIETQYFTAQSLLDTLTARMRDRRRPGLQVVLVMPTGADSEKERLVLGPAQNRLLASLAAVALETETQLRIYSSRASCEGGEAVATFIHSKLMIVDDRLLCVGSANLTNRSLLLDTELCLSFEDASGTGPTSRSIAQIRSELLAEHSGAQPDAAFFRVDGLVGRLDELGERGKSRLFPRPVPLENSAPSLHLERLFDPEKPLDQFELSELVSFQTELTPREG